jgi:hypothetical protein
MLEYPNISVTKTYSLTYEQINKVSKMAQRSGKSQGEIVRDAIDLLYSQFEQPANDDGDSSDCAE